MVCFSRVAAEREREREKKRTSAVVDLGAILIERESVGE